MRIFGNRAYEHKPKETLRKKFASRALAGTLLGYCLGGAYRVPLDEGNIIVESKDVRIVEDIWPGSACATNNSVIEFGLSDENDVIDEIVHGAAPPTERKDVISNILEFVYGQMENELLTEVNLVDQTYYPSARRSKQRTARIPSDRFNNYEMHRPTQLKKKGNVSESFESAVASSNRAVSQMAMEKAMATLGKMGAWDLINLPQKKKNRVNEMSFSYKSKLRRGCCTRKSTASGKRI